MWELGEKSEGLLIFYVGSAMDVLHSMQNFLRGRPKSFKSIDHAIEWRWKPKSFLLLKCVFALL